MLASQLPESSEIHPIDVMTAIGLIECLLRFLKGAVPFLVCNRQTNVFMAEPVPLDVSATYFDDAPAFLDQLRQLIGAAQLSQQTPQTIHLIHLSFAIMLEASLYSKSVWQYYKQHLSSLQLLRSLLLESPYEKLREGVVRSIRGVCSSLPSYVLPYPTELVTSLKHLAQGYSNRLSRICALLLAKLCLIDTTHCSAQSLHRAVLLHRPRSLQGY